MSLFSREKLAQIAEAEGKKKLTWKPGSEADKYKKKFWPKFGKDKWSWCAAYGTWCAEAAGLVMPVKCPSKFGYTFALVEGWQQWAIEKGLYQDNYKGLVPQRGWLALFDYDQRDLDDKDTDWENHIGVVLGVENGLVKCAEGNHGNATGIFLRSAKIIQGYVVIPEGYNFATPDAPEKTEPKAPAKVEEWKAVQAAINGLLAKEDAIKVDGVPGPQTQAAMLRLAKSI